MKNATKYQKKVRKLLSGMPKPSRELPAEPDPLDWIPRAVLTADAAEADVDKAIEALEKEFVDVNELRVSPPKEIVDAIGRDYPYARAKARELTGSLNAIFTRRNTLSFAHTEEMSKRDLRRHLLELGLSPYGAAYMMLVVFGGHAIPVDRSLVECLEMDECIEPGSELEDVQGFLERIIRQKDAWAAHLFFRAYVTDHAKDLERKHKAEAEAAAKAEAEARARQEAEAKAKEEAEAKAREEAAARSKAKKSRKSAKGAKAKKAAAKAGGKKAAKSAGKQAPASSKAKKTSSKSSSKASKRKTAGKKSKKSSKAKKQDP